MNNIPNSNNSSSSGTTSDINLDGLMWNVVSGVGTWPEHDLF